MILMADDNANFRWEFEPAAEDAVLNFGDCGDDDGSHTIDIDTPYSILEETPKHSESMEKDQSTNHSSRGCTGYGVTNNETSKLGEGLQGSHTTGPHLVGQLAGSALSFLPKDLDSSGSRSWGSSNVLDHADENSDFSTRINSPVDSRSKSRKGWMSSAPLLKNGLEVYGVPQDTQSYAGFDDFQLQYQIPTSSSGFSLDADTSNGTLMENSNIDMGNQALGENSMKSQAIRDNQSSLSFDRFSESGTHFKQDSGNFSDDMYEPRDWYSGVPYNRDSNNSAFFDSSSHYSHGSFDIQRFLSNGETMGNVKDEKRELLVDIMYNEGNILRGGCISGVSTSDYSELNNSTCLGGDLITPLSVNPYSKPTDGTSVHYTDVHHLSPAQSNTLSPKQEVCMSTDANSEPLGSMIGTEEFDDFAISFDAENKTFTERGQKSLFLEDLSSLGSRRDMKYSLNDKENTVFGLGRTHHSHHISGRINIVDDGSFCVIDSLSSTFSVQQPGMCSKLSHCLKYESDCKPFQTQFMGSHHLRDSSESIKSNSCDKKSHVDDDADICILEEISKPVRDNPLPMTRKVIISSNGFVSSDPLLNAEVEGMKHKPNDERLVYRVALQDLSQPKLEAFPPEGVLAVPLLRHQRIALSWMVQKETGSHNCSGGILADDQGLGKTVSTISLILTERPPSFRNCQKSMQHACLEILNLDDDGDEVMEVDGLRNRCMEAKGRPAAGTLVVCPTSVLRQWADELHSKVTKEADLSVLVYHGSSRTKDPNELAKYDVVLTTYSIVSMEVPKQPLVDKDDGKTTLAAGIISQGLFGKKRKYPPSSDKRAPKSKRGLENALLESAARPLAKVGWFRVVLDEAQSIKNHRTQVAWACCGLRAKRRWCLSGTPIQNSIDDLYSYFRFLRYDPYSGYKSFCSMIKHPISRSPSTGYRKLQAVLKTIMLRRTKGTLLDGEPIINLPPKTIELKKVEFSDEERDFYLKLEADSRKQFQVYAAAGTVKQNYVNILLMLLRLRQACDHPALIRSCDSTSMWKSSVETAKKLPHEKQSFLLDKLGASLALCGICNDPPEDAVVSICGHVFCNQCIFEHLIGDDNKCPDTSCKVQLNAALVFSKATLCSSLGNQSVKDNLPGLSASKFVETSGQSTDSSSFLSSKIKAALEVLVSMSKSESSSSEKSSSKSINEISSCLEASLSSQSEEMNMNISGERSCILDKDRNSPVKDKDLNASVKFKVEKAIVFSQWTRMLDLFESCLQSSSIQYRRLDGTMSVTARDRAVKDFNTLPKVTVMIMSLKAASLGLNMVAACHVLMLDLWWNPTTEDQAVDRAHRIGQTRPVKVLRLTVKDTVEDRILALQQKKREMVASAFGEDETGSHQTRLTVEDLQYLFEG